MTQICHRCGSQRNRRGMIRCIQCNGLYHLSCIPNSELVVEDQYICLPCSTNIPESEDEGAVGPVVENFSTPVASSASNVGTAAGNEVNEEVGGARRRPVPSPRELIDPVGRPHQLNLDNMVNRVMQAFQVSQKHVQSILDASQLRFNELIKTIEESSIAQTRRLEELETRLNQLGRELEPDVQSNPNSRTMESDRYRFPPTPGTFEPSVPRGPQTATGYVNQSVPQPEQEARRNTPTVTPGSYEDLPSFNGNDPKQWIKFEATYNYQRRIGVDADRRLSNLITALDGPAYTLVADRLLLRDNPDLVVSELREHYANVDRVIRRMMNEIMKAKAPRDQPKYQLIDLAVMLKHLVTTIKYYDRREMLINVLLEEEIVDKLRDEHQDSWGLIKRNDPNANLEQLSEFLLERSKDRSAVQPERITRKPLQPKKPAVPLNLLQDIDSDSDASSDVNDMATALLGVVSGKDKSPNKRSINCFDCGENHRLVRCRTFLNRTVPERWAIIAAKRVCINCLSSTEHATSNCPKTQTCLHLNCSLNHHYLLHFIPPVHGLPKPSDLVMQHQHSEAPSNDKNDTYDENKKLIGAHHIQSKMYYGVAPLYIRKANGEEILVYAMLDTGAGMSLMSSALLNQLQLSGSPATIKLKWTNSHTVIEETAQKVSLIARVPGKPKLINLDNIYTVTDLDLPSQTQLKSELSQYSHLKNVPVPEFTDKKPQILIGLPHAKLCAGRKLHCGDGSGPVANKTALGWVLYGTPKSNPSSTVAIVQEDEYNTLESLVKLAMSIDSFGTFGGTKPYQSRHDQRVSEIVNRTMKQVGDRYEIGLFWRDDDITLPNSYPMAMKRLICTENAVKRAGLLDWTNNKIEEFIDKGYARVATIKDLQTNWKRIWYLPMFVVVNPNKLPIKPRIVMDGAAVVDDKSLNSYLLPGNEHPASLVGALFRFRIHKYAISGDVKEMFSQVKIIKEDQQCQRFLWRHGNAKNKPTIYIFQNMTFGLSCSPSSAQLVKNHHAAKYRELHPLVYNALTNGTYVDDYLDSQPTIELAIKTTSTAITIMSEINFHLVGFQSNSKEVMSKLPESHIKTDLVALDPDPKVNQLSKILGMNWNRSTDTLVFQINEPTKNELETLITKPTKRQLLKVVMKLFDPLGIIAHGLIRGRMLLQEVWREGIGWDSLLPEALVSRVTRFAKMILDDITSVTIPRLYAPLDQTTVKIEMHVFTDASEDAMAAVVYFRYLLNDVAAHVAFVFGKTKVMPIKTLSVPKAELTAAVMGVRIGKEVIERHPIQLSQNYYWTDSKCVIAQLHTNKKLPPFTSNRVGEILDSTTRTQWSYVPSIDNPADWGTKIKANAFTDNCPWFVGPGFLMNPNEWPQPTKIDDIGAETILVTQPMQLPEFSLIKNIKELFKNNWWCLRRIVARRIRYVKLKFMKKQSEESFITPKEYEAAEDYIFASIQAESFSDDYACLLHNQPLPKTSKLISFNPILTTTGVIRMTSRLENSTLSYCARRPAILPKDHPIVMTLVRRYHEDFIHIGEETVIAAIRQKVWIPAIRTLVRQIAHECNFCKRRNAKPFQPKMGILPTYRTDHLAYPFEHTGIDVFGPIYVAIGRGKQQQKRWVMIFTCLVVRAVLFEVIEEMTSDIALCVIENFSTRNGPIKHIYSDRGTNFVGVANELERMRKTLTPRLAERTIQWHFNPSETPHFGGAWERLIRSTKIAMGIIQYQKQTPTDFTLKRALDRVAGFLNNRPLTNTPIDPTAEEVLTPSHFINLKATQSIVPSDNDGTKYLQYNRVTDLYHRMVERWAKEYLPTITQASKWRYGTDSPKEGGLALFIDRGKTPLKWRLVRISKLYYGKDNVARVADIYFPDGSTKRTGIVNLAMLNLSTSNESVDGSGNVPDPNRESSEMLIAGME